MKKFFALAACALITSAAMAQSPKAQSLMDQQKYNDALPLIESEIGKVTNDLNAAVAKAQAKGKTADASKFNAKYAGLYNQKANCWKFIFAPEFDKAAKSEPFDTAFIAKACYNMTEAALLSDKYDHTPDAKGAVKSKIALQNAELLNICFVYDFYAGAFLAQGGHDLQGSIDVFKKYLAVLESPAFAIKKDEVLADPGNIENIDLAKNIIIDFNYKLKNWNEIVSLLSYDFSKEKNARDLYYYKSEAVLGATNDSVQYEAVLKDAVLHLDDPTDYVNTLIGIYQDRNNVDGAMAVGNDLLAQDPQCKYAYYIQGYAKMNISQNYAEARQYFEKALAIDPDYVLANANMAHSFTNEFITRYQNGEFKYWGKKFVPDAKKAEAEKKNAEARAYYENARPYMEKVRALAPDRSRIWAPALQQIYANLDMDKEADEMDAIMSNN